MLKQQFKTILILGLFIGLFALTFEVMQQKRAPQEITFSEFIEKALPKDGESKVKSIVVKGEEIKGTDANGAPFHTLGDLNEYQKDIINHGVELKYESTKDSIWLSILGSWLPTIFLILLFFYNFC